MINNELDVALEAVLFACGSPVPIDKIAELFEISNKEAEEAFLRLCEKYESPDFGISVIRMDNSYQFCTKTYLAPFVKRALEMRKTPPLSKAALEVLAIIAYNQPVTRLFIDSVRGVDSNYVVSSLCDKGLVCEAGTLDAPGRPVLFATTESFLRCFGLQSLSELPEDVSIEKANTQKTLLESIGD